MQTHFNLSSRISALLTIGLTILYAQTNRGLELDVTKVGLRSRSEVVKILGRPIKSEAGPNGSDEYRWGMVMYSNDKATQIDYEFKTPASSVEAALR